MREKTTYSELREKLLSFERAATSYSSQAVYKEFDIGRGDDKQQHDDVVPKDIDRIKRKDKGKAKGKSKGSVRAKEKDGKCKDKGKGYGTYKHCV